MIFYEINLMSVPAIEIACTVDTARYKNRFDHPCDFVEIAILEKGTIIFEHDDGRIEKTSAGMVNCIFSDMACSTYLADDEGQRHSTVVARAKYTIHKYDNEENVDIDALKERLSRGGTILLPNREMLEESYDEALNIIRKIASLSSSHDAKSKLSAQGYWFSLAGVMTDFVMRKIDKNSNITPSENVYISKACKYIHKYYTQKLTVSEIARHLNISEGYLHRIFRRTKGMGVLEYVNRHRIAVAIELINNRNISLKEAAFNVGIDEPAYMSRLFKKVTGTSYHEYFGSKEVP